MAESFDQHSFVAKLVITPLALVGGVFYCASTIGDLRERLHLCREPLGELEPLASEFG